MDLSVVVPTHDKAALLRRTLAALAVQDPGPGRAWEVVVVDDGSRDGTAALLTGLRAGYPVPLQVVSPPGNVGRARARNLGLAAARGRWVLFLDDDILAPQGLLAAHLDVLEGDARAGTIGYAVTDPELVDAPHFHYLDTRGVARLGAGPAPARFFVTQNAAVPRQALLEAGGFCEDFAAYGFEDMEAAFRLEDRAGIRFQALVHPVPLHIHHHSLVDYLAKRIACGRHSLPLIAALHPTRLAQMRLHHVLDAPGGAPGPGTRLLRRWLDSEAGRALPGWMGRWPVTGCHRPLWPALYCSLMNLAVLSCYRQGHLSAIADTDNKAE